MKCWWNGGVERKANPLLRECWTFLIYIFLHQQWKQCLEFALAKMYQKSSALSICFEMRRSPFANWIHYICRQKTTTSLWNLEQKVDWRKRNCSHRLIMHSITHKEGGGEGRCERRVGGEGGGRLLYTWARWNSMTICEHINFSTLIKRKFPLTAI